MRGIILAAGRGSRLGTMTDDRPKCLVELAGRPLLDWQITALRAAGIGEIAAVRGWCGERLEGRVDTLFDNPRWAETNMVESLARAASWLQSGDCVVSYSDIFYPARAVGSLIDTQADIAIAYDPEWRALWSRRFADPLSDAETFHAAPDGRLLDIGRRPSSFAEIGGQYMGLLKFTPAGWASVVDFLSSLAPAERDRLDMTSLLRRLIEREVPITAVPVAGPWGEVDSASDLALYEAMLASGEMESPCTA